jgi:hypothetical protein
MWLKLKNVLAPKLPALILGLFVGRLVSEQLAVQYSGSLWVAVLVTLGCCILAIVGVSRRPLRQTWPLLLLAGYVFYPDPNPLAAATAVFLVTAVYTQTIPLPNRILKFALLGSTLFFASLYILTLAPGLLPADSGEFQLVGATLGVAHPPGFPLYTLLSKLMTWLPIAATAAAKINLLSVISSSATLLILYLTVFRLTKRHVGAITAVISLGTATTFWAQATTANIRSFTALFAALAIFALVRHWQEKANTDRYLILFAAALSFGFTHHLSLAFMGLIFIIFLFLIDPHFFRVPSRWKRPFLAALLGLTPLLYLPLRAGADVPGASEGLNTVSGFLNHFLALGFQGDFFYFVKPVVLWPRLRVMGNVLTFQFSLWLLAAALLGWLLLLRRNWRMGLLLGGSFGLHTLVTASYRAPQTVEYMLPAYLPVAICIGLASGYLSDFAQKQRLAVRWLPLTVTAVLLTAAVGQGWQRWPSFRLLHQNEDARDYAQTILQDAPPDSLILANWHWVTPLWYLQTVEGSRPDVTIEYVTPAGEPYSQTWANRIAEGVGNGRSVIATYLDEEAYAALPPAQPIGEALLFQPKSDTNLPISITPLDLFLNGQVQIFGYQLSQPSVEIGEEVRLVLSWQAAEPTPLFIHLLDETGNIVAQADGTAVPQPNGLTRTQFYLTPRRGPGNFTLRLGSGADFQEIGSLQVTLASLPPATKHPIYRPLGKRPSPILIGYDWDNTLPGQTRLYLHWKNEDGYWSTTRDNLTPAEIASLLPSTQGPWGIPQSSSPIADAQPNEHYVPFGQGIVWTGDALDDLQIALSPGDEVALPMRFLNGRPLLRDYVVSTRLVGYEEDNVTWAWCDLVDGVPAMGGIPTLKWIQGSQVQSPRTIVFPPRTEPATFSGFCQSEKPAPDAPLLFVDNAATPGQTVGGILRLYDAFTNRPLPILDERITAVTSWVPLGSTTIK